MLKDVIGIGALNIDLIYEVKKPRLEKEAPVKVEHGGEVFHSPEEFELILSWINRVGHLVWESGGGQAANTCYALARLGFKVGFIGVVGKDKFGHFLLESLSGVDTSRVRKRGRSGVCVVLLDESGERTNFVFPNANDTLSLDDFDFSYLNTTRYLYLSSFAGKRPLEAQKKLVEKVSPSVKIALDPGELHAQRGLKELEPILKRCSLLFATEREVEYLTGEKAPKGIGKLLEKGVSVIVVKKGSRGSEIYTEKERLEVPAWQVGVVDTTGAGDVYAAGFLAALLLGKSLEKAGHIASKLASSAVQGYGRQGYPSQDELEVILEEMTSG
jgi:ribokinase